MQQKLLTIYLNTGGYKRDKMLVGSYGDMNVHVEEHVQADLDDGWRIHTLAAMGGAAEGVFARGWLAVVLQK